MAKSQSGKMARMESKLSAFTKKTKVVPCPCCKGQKRLTVIEYDDEDGRTVVTKPMCTHCMGCGEIPVEIDDESERMVPRY